MTVSFADTSALVVGPPDPQVKEFFVYDSTELIQMILDSVQRTLQQNFVDTELSAPEDVYKRQAARRPTCSNGAMK